MQNLGARFHGERVKAYCDTPGAKERSRLRFGRKMRSPKKKKPVIGMGAAYPTGLRAECAANRHQSCNASRCTCECHQVKP